MVVPAIAKLTSKQWKEFAETGQVTLTKDQEQAVVAQVLSDYNDALNAKRPLHEKWARYEEYYKNNQWKYKNVDDKRVKPTTNYCFSTIEAIMPFLTADVPDPIVLPTKIDDEELAENLTKIVKILLKKNKIEKTLQIVERSRLKFGAGIYKVYFDPTKYNGLGDVAFDPVDNINFFPDPEETDHIQNGRFCMTATKRSLKYAKERYPDKANQIEADQKYEEFKTYDSQDDQINPRDEFVTIIEYWTKDPEQGLVRIVVVGETLVRYQPRFYMHGKYPFVFGVDYPLQKSLWGMGEIEQIENMQDTLNKLLQIIIENVALANGQLLVDVNMSGIKDIKSIANQLWKPGLTIPVNDINSIKKLDGVVAPAWVINLVQMIKQDIELVTGISPIYMGQSTGSVTAASGILALQEQATARVRLKLKEQARMLEEIVKFIVAYIVEFYNEDRTFRYLDKNRTPTWITLNGNDLAETDTAGNKYIPEFDVDIEVGYDTPMSRAYIEQQAMQLFQMGVIDAIEVMKTMNFPFKDEIINRLEQKQEVLSQLGGLPEGVQSPALMSQLAQLSGLENKNPSLPGGMNVRNTNSPQDAQQQRQQMGPSGTETLNIGGM